MKDVEHNTTGRAKRSRAAALEASAKLAASVTGGDSDSDCADDNPDRSAKEARVEAQPEKASAKAIEVTQPPLVVYKRNDTVEVFWAELNQWHMGVIEKVKGKNIEVYYVEDDSVAWHDISETKITIKDIADSSDENDDVPLASRRK